MDFERCKKPVRQISLVPLINVVFLLLIFFLVAGAVEKIDVIDVELPMAESGEIIEQGPIEILLGLHDALVANDMPMQQDALADWLKPRLADDPARVITIKADARLPAAALIDLLNLLEAQGAKHLSLTTQQGSAS
jgi:biopolymer transport protein ExbD